MQEIDGTAQLLACRKDRLILSNVHAEARENPADEPFDPYQDRPEQPHHPLHRLRNRERNTIRRVEGRRLGQHFGEDDNQHRHQGGRIDHAGIAEPCEQNARRQSRRGNIGRIVAEQQRADQALALLQQLVDDGSTAVSVLFQPRHAGTRRRSQRRFTPREKGGKQQADQDDDK